MATLSLSVIILLVSTFLVFHQRCTLWTVPFSFRCICKTYTAIVEPFDSALKSTQQIIGRAIILFKSCIGICISWVHQGLNNKKMTSCFHSMTGESYVRFIKSQVCKKKDMIKMGCVKRVSRKTSKWMFMLTVHNLIYTYIVIITTNHFTIGYLKNNRQYIIKSNLRDNTFLEFCDGCIISLVLLEFHDGHVMILRWEWSEFGRWVTTLVRDLES